MRAAIVVFAGLAAACHSRTELLIGIATDIHAPDLIDEVDLDISNNSNLVTQEHVPWSLTGVADLPFNLPGSYGIFSADGSEPEVNITLTGLKNGNPIVVRQAIISLITDETLFYRIGITAGCETMQDCGSPDMTCVEGTCQPARLDSRQFPAFSDDLVTTLSCDSAIHYIDTGTGQPMPTTPDASACPDAQCKEGTCLTPPPGSHGCMADADCPATAPHCDTATGQCSGGPHADGGLKMMDGGGSSGCVQPKLYNITWNCSGTTCSNNYPGITGSVTIDSNGVGDYVKDLTAGIDGTCTLQNIDPTSCTALVSCSITNGGTGTASAMLQFTGGTGMGNIEYTLTSPVSCSPTCTVTLN